MNRPDQIPNPAEVLRRMKEGPQEPELISRDGVVSIDIRYPDGEVRRGEFRYELPVSINDRVRIGVVAASLRMGASPESLDQDTALIIYKTAYLAVACSDVPAWMRGTNGEPDWASAPDSIVNSVFLEVNDHEIRFRVGTRNGKAQAGAQVGPAGSSPGTVGTEVGAAE